jgi:hypothetical protein
MKDSHSKDKLHKGIVSGASKALLDRLVEYFDDRIQVETEVFMDSKVLDTSAVFDNRGYVRGLMETKRYFESILNEKQGKYAEKEE